ncbi:MAG TPA: hypothetical protein VH417_01120 [Vicinamibacterales bacterium]|jgi:hypothetical protein
MNEEPMIASWMARVAAAPVPAAQIPDAETILWQARLRQRAEDRRRAQQPIELMERIQLGAVAVTVAAVLVWSLPTLLSLFRLARI